LNPLGVTHECDRQTDGQTDILVANGALNYTLHSRKPLKGIHPTGEESRVVEIGIGLASLF